MFSKKSTYRDFCEDLKGYYPRLWRHCLSITGNQVFADDLAQATCLRALERSDQFQRGTRLDSWMFRIASRIWIDEMRKQAVRIGGGLLSIDEIDLPDTNKDPTVKIFLRETLLKVMALPEAQRVSVNLVYIEGYSCAEAAEILDIPIGTVMSRLSVARKKLSGLLDEKEKAL